MAAPTGPEQARELGRYGCYVYGIVPADVEPTGDVRGVGDPPGRIELVRHGNLAALVSEVNLTAGLGTPADLRAHAQILDTAVVEVPVLPLRFGTVMATKDAVAGDLLAGYQEAFAAALKQAEGRVQYVVKGRYVEQAVLAEALAELPQAARLAKLIRGADPDATRQERIRLGEIISKAITAKRKADTLVVGEVVAPCCVASVAREPTHELDAVHAALLVQTSHQDDLEQALSGLASDWEGRIEIRLLGPMAPYDFTPAPIAPGSARLQPAADHERPPGGLEGPAPPRARTQEQPRAVTVTQGQYAGRSADTPISR
jgi:Gas vesicle synthesis protein GvpL/GvpF